MIINDEYIGCRGMDDPNYAVLYVMYYHAYLYFVFD